MSIRLHLFFIIFIFFWRFGSGYEYCKGGRQKTLCGAERHIYCHPEQMKEKRLEQNLPELEHLGLIPMTRKLKRILRQLHNDYRNDLACGKIEDNSTNKFPRAARMREVIWDDELAFLAKTHAKLCTLAHDDCRNTFRIKNSGQNIAYFAKPKYSKVIPVIEDAVASWFGESKNIIDGKKAAELYPPETEFDTPFGYFTLAASDYVSRIGCAMSICEHSKSQQPWHYLLTCNYDWRNMKDYPVYKHDNTFASECSFWKNEKSNAYPCLCKNNGNMKYDITMENTDEPDEPVGPNPSDIKTTKKPGEPEPEKTTKTTKKPGEPEPEKTTKTTKKPTTIKPTKAPTTKKPDKPEEPDVSPSMDYLQKQCGGKEAKFCKDRRYLPLSETYFATICHPEYMVNLASGKRLGWKLLNMLPMDKTMRTLILDLHDKYRNHHACGNAKDSVGNPYPTASRQRVLMWDWELAYVAELHARQCIFAHDRCRNTYRIPFAGQNLGMVVTSNKTHDPKKQIIEWMEMFYDECRFAKNGTTVVKKFLGDQGQLINKTVMIGHFTQLVSDYNSRVGCAYSMCKKDKLFQHVLTCDYDGSSMGGVPVYEFGKPATRCGFWKEPEKSDKYECLCKNKGIIKPYGE